MVATASKLVFEAITAINASENRQQLLAIRNTVGRMQARKVISDAESTWLDTLISYRQMPRQDANPMKVAMSRLFGFRRRSYHASPDKQKSRERRRTLAGSSSLPPEMRAGYTEGQRAVLTIIALEIKARGVCTAALDAIAARAGVCRTTVQNTLSEARRRGDVRVQLRPQPGRKNKTNLIKVISQEWLAWIRRGLEVARTIGSKTFTSVNPTEKKLLKHTGYAQHCGQIPALKQGWTDPDSLKPPRMWQQTRKVVAYA